MIVVHSLEPGETPSYSASHQASNDVAYNGREYCKNKIQQSARFRFATSESFNVLILSHKSANFAIFQPKHMVCLFV